MKPFQIQMFKDELNDLTQEQIAISVASHNGTAEHIGMAKTVLADLSEEHLEISCSAPLEPGEEKSQWANPCSGKHSAIIRGLAQKVSTLRATPKKIIHTTIYISLSLKNTAIPSYKLGPSTAAGFQPMSKPYLHCQKASTMSQQRVSLIGLARL